MTKAEGDHLGRGNHPGASHVYDTQERASASAEPSAVERSILAVLKAAKPRGLVLHREPHRKLCIGSAEPNEGWYVPYSFDLRRANPDGGGPWSREFIEYVVCRGLIGINPYYGQALQAHLTRPGREFLRASQPKRSKAATPASQAPGMPPTLPVDGG